MSNVSYPFDTTGLASTNLVTNEHHVLTELNAQTYRIIVPEFAPFYLDNLKVYFEDLQGNKTPLVQGLDFNPCLEFVGGTRSIGKSLYGGLAINTELVNGLVSIDYQTLGGTWTADRNLVLKRLAELNYNPRITVWDIITNIQETFPPINHDVDANNTMGYDKLIECINSLSAIIASNGSFNSALLVRHVKNTQRHGNGSANAKMHYLYG